MPVSQVSKNSLNFKKPTEYLNSDNSNNEESPSLDNTDSFSEEKESDEQVTTNSNDTIKDSNDNQNQIQNQNNEEDNDQKIVENFLDFESSVLGEYGNNSLRFYRWNLLEEQYRDYSTIDVVTDGMNKFLRIWISDNMPDAISSFDSTTSKANINSIVRGFTIARYLHPESDAIRLKIKMERGTIGLTVGTPVSQLGNSDALTKVKYLSPSNKDDCLSLEDGWLECDFDLNDQLIRNTRRGNFTIGLDGTTKNSQGQEIIYLSRWIQEPLALYVVTYDQQDNKIIKDNPIFYLDDFQAINKGKGRPFFNTYPDSTVVASVQNFEQTINNAFTVDFGFPTHQNAPVISHVSQASPTNNEEKSIQIVSRTFEESAWTGFNAYNGDQANAVSFDLKITYASNETSEHIIDFIALANPTGDIFQWSGLENIENPNYNYKLSKSNSTLLDFSIFHARRIIPRDQWITVTIPFADFVAIYGNGLMSDYHKEQKPLLGSEISVIGLQATWVNIRANTEILIDNIKYIKINNKSESELRSYWQGQAFIK